MRFMRGMIGRFFYEYGLTVTFAVAVSLLVAFTLTPMLSSRLLRREEHHGKAFELLEQAYTRLEDIYARTLRLALARRPLGDRQLRQLPREDRHHRQRQQRGQGILDTRLAARVGYRRERGEQARRRDGEGGRGCRGHGRKRTLHRALLRAG